MARLWFQYYLLFFAWKIGEDVHSDSLEDFHVDSYFSHGWFNHHLLNIIWVLLNLCGTWTFLASASALGGLCQDGRARCGTSRCTGSFSMQPSFLWSWRETNQEFSFQSTYVQTKGKSPIFKKKQLRKHKSHTTSHIFLTHIKIVQKPNRSTNNLAFLW